ncbi:unnamed protein product [Aphanomyces euteiches]
MQWRWFGAIFAAFAVYADVQTKAMHKNVHRITALPNYNDKHPIDFEQYAGRMALPTAQVELFYWLVHSENDPKNDPLVLWLNGGPGCSSLAGLFTELGPFVVEGDLSVKRNKYAWNRKTNMVFLELPAGVGFSKPLLDSSQYNEEFTTDRAYEFLELFFEHYPTYHNRPFYIMGESYAGRYIPFLVHKLVTAPIKNVTLAGFSIGNPATDDKVDGNALMDFYYTHALISRQNYQRTTTYCVGEEIRYCLSSAERECSKECADALHAGIVQVDKQALNPYNIYGDVCLLENGQAKALHYTLHESSILPRGDIGLKALIYSGDADSVVNFIGTERWITDEGLNLTLLDDWKAWFGPDKQLAGYSQVYTNLTFKTVKGAGHMVAAVRPLHALYMFECFIFGDDTCSSFMYPSDSLELLSGETNPIGASSVNLTVTATTHVGSATIAVIAVGLVGAVVATVRHYRRRRAKYTRLL